MSIHIIQCNYLLYQQCDFIYYIYFGYFSTRQMFRKMQHKNLIAIEMTLATQNMESQRCGNRDHFTCVGERAEITQGWFYWCRSDIGKEAQRHKARVIWRRSVQWLRAARDWAKERDTQTEIETERQRKKETQTQRVWESEWNKGARGWA